MVTKYIYYKFPNPKDRKVYETENMILVLGKTMSLYKNDNLVSEKFEKENTDNPLKQNKRLYKPVNTGKLEEFISIYKNQDKIWVSRNLIKNYYWEEKRPIIKWQIQKKTMLIAGYKCFMARGLSQVTLKYYNAWFSYDLPFSSGPLYVGGLPGLILKLEEDDKSRIWLVTKFEKPTDATKVVSFNKNSIRSTRAEFEKKLKDLKENSEKIITKSINGQIRIDKEN